MVTTRLSSKGQVVLPQLVRSKLGLAPGMRLVCKVEGESVILTPAQPAKRTREYMTHPLTGLRVTKKREGAEAVSSKMVAAALEDFP